MILGMWRRGLPVVFADADSTSATKCKPGGQSGGDGAGDGGEGDGGDGAGDGGDGDGDRDGFAYEELYEDEHELMAHA